MLLVVDSYGPSCDCMRIFAEMGDCEINEIVNDIVAEFCKFEKVTPQHIKSEICRELTQGETEIHISSDDESLEYIVVSTSIDSGYSWSNDDDIKVDERCCREIRKGDTVFVSVGGYYGEAGGVYSAKMPEMDEYEELTVE